MGAPLILAGTAVLFWCGVHWLLARAVLRTEVRLAKAERDRQRAERLAACARGDHRTTIDASRATMFERCLDCGRRELLGHAFVTGTNRRTRRAS